MKKPTGNMRWDKRTVVEFDYQGRKHSSYLKVLQQEWEVRDLRDSENAWYKVWEDVPIVEDDDES